MLTVFLVGVFGAIAGSFLNVVIHRLPLGLSIIHPRSFCPRCGNPIRWYHNWPVVGWLTLRGRCHDCGEPIAMRYPLVEAATALIFVAVWDALFRAKLIPGAGQLASDWPLAGAYFTLYGGLLVSSALDIESYTIDIRVALLVMTVGLACHTAMGLPAEVFEPNAPGVTAIPVGPLGLLPPALCVIALAMGLTWLLTWAAAAAIDSARGSGRTSSPPMSLAQSAPAGIAAEHSPAPDPLATASARGAAEFQPGVLIALCLLILGQMAWQAAAPHEPSDWRLQAGAIRVLIAAAICMMVLILASWEKRPVDHQIIGEIEASRSQARPMALRELLWFMPALVVGFGLLLVWRRTGAMERNWVEMFDAFSIPAGWRLHLGGAMHAAASMIWAAAMGWTVRILGTLAFGKEAFGTGDVYLMAAIGAVAGIWNVFFGFFIAAMLALVGVLAMLLRKTSRAIPFGPWLALGSFVCMGVQVELTRFFQHAGSFVWAIIADRAAWTRGV